MIKSRPPRTRFRIFCTILDLSFLLPIIQKGRIGSQEGVAGTGRDVGTECGSGMDGAYWENRLGDRIWACHMGSRIGMDRTEDEQGLVCEGIIAV